jgi:membrane-bound ClpP family serine protease
MSVGTIYAITFAIGLGYAILTGLASHLFGGDVSHDVHMEVGTDLPLSPLSPTVIATFLTGFGGGGLVASSYLGLSVGKGVLTAIMTGILLSGGTYTILLVLFRNTQAGAEYSSDEMVGRVVEIITPIPENGMGEIAFVVKGTRVSGPARSLDGKAIPRGAQIIIEKVVGNVYYVKEEAPHGNPRRVSR